MNPEKYESMEEHLKAVNDETTHPIVSRERRKYLRNAYKNKQRIEEKEAEAEFDNVLEKFGAKDFFSEDL